MVGGATHHFSSPTTQLKNAKKRANWKGLMEEIRKQFLINTSLKVNIMNVILISTMNLNYVNYDLHDCALQFSQMSVSQPHPQPIFN